MNKKYTSLKYMDENYWNKAPFLFDENGLPIVDYGDDIGVVYNPITIEQYALVMYNKFIETKREKYKNRFFVSVHWLVEHIKISNTGVCGIPYLFNLKRYGLNAPWYSGMELGQLISVLIRAYAMERKAEYKELCRKIYNSFLVPVENGGVLVYDENKNPWVEEYPNKNLKTFVLNGYIFSLIGILEYEQFFMSQTNEKKSDIFIDSLFKRLKRYEKNCWLLYQDNEQIEPIYCSNEYMKMQALQMLQLHSIEKHKNKAFIYIYAKWHVWYFFNPIRLFRLLPTHIKIIVRRYL